MSDESSVRVAVRIRPQIAREKIEMCRVCTNVTPDEPQVWLGSDKAFTYDYVYDMGASQEQLYASCVEELIEGCFDGYNATIFAYGQTGSGKTYTMGTGLDIESCSDTLGVIPRAVIQLFSGMDSRQINAQNDGLPIPDYKIAAHFMELYNEEIIDLLASNYKGSKRTGVKIHEDSDGGIVVSGVTSIPVSSVDEALQCLRSGALSRTTASTNMNTHSSRSHAIFTLFVQQQRVASLQDAESNQSVPDEYETLSAKIHFVDLAGSERMKRTGATGERAREGISINCGLLALGNVISALGDTSKKILHVPYRDSKLTRLLQDSLGGNSRTLMIACVSPSDTDFMETLNTLKYANRARNIKNRVSVNQDKTSKTITLLRQEIMALQVELLDYKQGKRIVDKDGIEGVNDMYHENQMLLTESHQLRTRIKALQETVDMLTVKNAQLLSEKACSTWTESSEDTSMAHVVQNYLKEIEELKAKLCESEHVCEQLRKQQHNNKVNFSPMNHSTLSPLHTVLNSDVMNSFDNEPQRIDDLLEEAKTEVKRKKDEMCRMKEGALLDLPPKNGEEDIGTAADVEMEDCNNYESSDEDEEEDEEDQNNGSYNAELAELTSEISIKQKLIDSLEATQRRLETMKFQYEEKLNLMINKIKVTQDERDKVLNTIQQKNHSSSASEERIKSVRQEYELKLSQMEGEVKKLRTAQKEHAKLMKERSVHERQLRALKEEMSEMKRNKVKLINKMKEEVNRAKKEDLKKNKEIAQLRKEHRKKESYIKTLESDIRVKKSVLQRKTEEISNLKKAPRRLFNNKVIRRLRDKPGLKDGIAFSPKVAKQKWQSIEQSVNKLAYNKQTVYSLERDMERWLKERESLSRQLDRIRRRRERVSPLDSAAYDDLNEQMDACKANIDYIHENISECQENIMSIEESKDVMEQLEPNRILTSLGRDEVQYIISKLVSMSVSLASSAAQRLALMSELEGKIKQMEQTVSVQEQLLAHVLRDNDMNVYHLMSSLVAADDHTSASTESSRSSSPNALVADLGSHAMDTNGGELSRRKTDKARRKQATTEDMLFSVPSNKLLSSSAMNINHISESVGPEVVSVSAPSTLDPRMTSSLEGAWLKPSKLERMKTSVAPAFTDQLLQKPAWPSSSKSLLTNQVLKSSAVPSKTLEAKQQLSVFKRPKTTKNTSPDKTRKRVPVISTLMFNFNTPMNMEIANEVTPPTSPLTLRRNLSKEENVFKRLTSTTSSVKDNDCFNSGIINPHLGKISSRSILTCTHIAQGHTKAVLSICATDVRIFSASKDRTVKIWDLITGQEIQTLGGHPNNVNCVKYSEKDNLCFSVSSYFIKIWDLRESPSKCIKTLTSSGLTSSGSVQPATKSRTLQMPPGESLIPDIALSQFSHTIYSATGNIVRSWDLRKFMSVGKLSGGHQAAVMCLAVGTKSFDQDVVVTGSKDHYIKVFDVGGTNCSGLINARKSLNPPHYDGVQSLVVHDKALFSGSRDTCIKKWDLEKGELVHSLNNAHKDWICAMCVLPGGQIVLSGCRSGTVKMWSADSCRSMGELRAHASPINSITTNSSCIFTASSDCTIGLWRMRSSYDVSPELSDSVC